MEQYHSNLETLLNLSSASEDEIFEGFDQIDVDGASRVFETVIRSNANASSSDSVSSDEHGDNSSVSGDDSSSSSDDYGSSDDDGSSSDHHGDGTSSESEATATKPSLQT